MEIKEFIKNFADQFDEIEAETLTEETIFKDLDNWSSIVALSLMAMANEEYDVELRGDDIRNANTIGNLFEIVKSKM
jgi:acyl carrier protein